MSIFSPMPSGPLGRLGLYLGSHQAGAAVAMVTAERARQVEPGSELGRALATFLDEIEEDREVVRDAQHRLGVAPGRAGRLLVSGTDAARRALRTMVTARRTPLTRVAELELLVVGVTGKLRLWEALGDLADDEGALTDIDWEALQARALGQREVLAAHHRRACREAFAVPGCRSGSQTS
ncbi:hypothetical protein BH24ACT4_BH24ACT4_15280 [soil metagenome]